ncbi:hypothetical protein AURDEDRAFT_164792 [Auricularia subglabra TFB-10046 SS5]|nr:hypothetical protein AURDEDRAFT_164792 [Auricularia subglabra TFB-10046 SS5]
MPSYAPPGESASVLALERQLFAGGMLVMFGYGVFVSITGATVYMMLFSSPRKPSWPIIAYIGVLSVGATIFTATNWQWSQNMFIEFRAYPGGPSAYFLEMFDDWVNTFSNAALFANSILVDALVLWRTYLIYDYRKRVIVVPVLWLIATTVLSILTLIQTATPNTNPWQAVQFVVPYFRADSVALNLTMTLMIAGRLIYIRNKLGASLGGQHTSPYLSMAAMLIESSALYSVAGIITIVAFATGSNVAVFMVPLLGEVMCIAPMLILFRVGFGRGYTRSKVRWNSSAYISSVDLRAEQSQPGASVSLARPPAAYARSLAPESSVALHTLHKSESQQNLHFKFPPSRQHSRIRSGS